MILVAICEGLLFAHHLTFFFIYTKFYSLELLSYQILETTLAAIICLNPLFGYLSDRFEIWGSKRRSYLLILSFIGTVSYALVGSTYYSHMPVWVIFILHYLIDASNTFRNVIVDSICVINHNIAKFKLKASKESSSNSSVSVLFTCRLSGRIVSIVLLGTLYNILSCRCCLISRLHLSVGHFRFGHRRLLHQGTENRSYPNQLQAASSVKTWPSACPRSSGKTSVNSCSPIA
jgi:hypothetical protein